MLYICCFVCVLICYVYLLFVDILCCLCLYVDTMCEGLHIICKSIVFFVLIRRFM